MGRIKTQLIKRTTLELAKQHRDKFNHDYTHNKQMVAQLLTTESKKLRNIVSGYITRLMKAEE